MRKSKWGSVWNLKLCILPTGRFFLTFPILFLFSHFFFPLDHLFYAKRLICLSWLICSASGFRHPDKSVPLKTVI